MAGTVVADTLQADSTSTLVLKNGVANTPPTIQDSAGTQIGTFCRAWVNFNGSTVTNPASTTGIRGSFNVSSILDNGTGNYTVNLTTAMPDTNYSVNITQNIEDSASFSQFIGVLTLSNTSYSLKSTTQVQMRVRNPIASNFDPFDVNVAIFR
jgi:hypothetical protein